MKNKLTVISPNKNRLAVDSEATKLFLASLQWQDTKSFEILIVDGQSDNNKELQEYLESYGGEVPIKMITRDVPSDPFPKCLLNNIGIRTATTDYMMTTDVDIAFGREFMTLLMERLAPKTFVESRCMYWKTPMAKKVYSGIVDMYNDLESCKVGRIKKRTTPGACQCMHIDQWSRLRGYDENYVGWGSEDTDLYTRGRKSGLKIKWMGESRDSIMAFHQPHPRNTKRDLEHQERNKKLLNSIKDYAVNPEGWGDRKD